MHQCFLSRSCFTPCMSMEGTFCYRGLPVFLHPSESTKRSSFYGPQMGQKWGFVRGFRFKSSTFKNPALLLQIILAIVHGQDLRIIEDGWYLMLTLYDCMRSKFARFFFFFLSLVHECLLRAKVRYVSDNDDWRIEEMVVMSCIFLAWGTPDGSVKNWLN